MKKAILIAVLMTLAGCSRDVDAFAGMVHSYSDPQTGCEYLRAYGGGITPRMGPDGKQVCTPPQD